MKSSGIAIIGHRGSSATHPENTIEAFRHAFEVGAHGVELDVIPSRDGVLAVAHDFITRAGQDIRLTDFADLSGVVRLEDVLSDREALASKGIFDIEMKARPRLGITDGEYAKLVVAAIEGAGTKPRCMVRSFDPRLLREIHRTAPDLAIAALTSNPLVNWVRYARRTYARCISPHFSLVTARRTARAHRAGLTVIPWTANHPTIWEKLLAAGVDGIITDDPGALADYLRRRPV